jgi:hypothetical protein
VGESDHFEFQDQKLPDRSPDDAKFRPCLDTMPPGMVEALYLHDLLLAETQFGTDSGCENSAFQAELEFSDVRVIVDLGPIQILADETDEVRVEEVVEIAESVPEKALIGYIPFGRTRRTSRP